MYGPCWLDTFWLSKRQTWDSHIGTNQHNNLTESEASKFSFPNYNVIISFYIAKENDGPWDSYRGTNQRDNKFAREILQQANFKHGKHRYATECTEPRKF